MEPEFVPEYTKQEFEHFVSTYWLIQDAHAEIVAHYIGVGDYAGQSTIIVQHKYTGETLEFIHREGRIYMRIRPDTVSGRHGYTVWINREEHHDND